ncbi:hypothetical protein [Streptomyces sp. PT19]|uniref:hypothetical protein n=1 Tax=Streptomyces sp. PT19 TaxID=3452239 RepID=UPI003F815FB8
MTAFAGTDRVKEDGVDLESLPGTDLGEVAVEFAGGEAAGPPELFLAAIGERAAGSMPYFRTPS